MDFVFLRNCLNQRFFNKASRSSVLNNLHQVARSSAKLKLHES